jgi:hypothetical protein
MVSSKFLIKLIFSKIRVLHRAEVDGDVMAARLVTFAFKAPAGAGRLHGR